MNKYDYVRKLVNECLSEGIEEYKVFDGSFADFQKRYPKHYSTDRGQAQSGGRVYVYNIQSYANLPSVFRNGQDRQFTSKIGRERFSTGENTDTYGKGVCCTLTYEGSYKNFTGGKASSYGGGKPVIVKYVLKNGLNDFLVFNDKIRQENGIKDNVATQLRKRFPPEFIRRYNDSIKNNRFNHSLSQSDKDLGIDMLDLPSDYLMSHGWNSCRNLVDFIIPDTSKRHDDLSDQELRQAGLRGYVSSGMTDNDLVVIKNFKDLMPIAYTDSPVPDERKVNWKTDWSDGKETINLTSEENFNNINNSEDVVWRFGHRYPEIDMKEPTTAGIVRVYSKGKYNYVDLDTDKEILPFNVDGADKLDPINKTAKINIGGKIFIMTVGDDKEISFMETEKDPQTGQLEEVGFPLDASELKDVISNG